ncbi:protein dispatched homolog 1 isoform X1 [Scophthalmus maximus]|uniref:protein dispatched homolog 1 isoform X1 n=1 Tax=Scophthalmus maximus TaxID=52904 RepID=UPI001FA83F89|nr:protein dispatched homolog 1 isoform X1 [Scophthalmus maximus]XP_047184613.1 protein dispatched homolog 1 isoform X1 [Scophthalmus maximus]XP_047184614.1 protein dispatched homolog 1 isoform X1 [Scophthalmus maximus]XP_047184615.1 protein dispatched homolog 1 isoform X1 [Scophthalmus maximus]XP_047184616.1 protein dispatched homolog 1 isoform X1 [Scophthalmus maximus]XP_047184617.1 protein dispatched homolog 1 isoform X1 [Scophthalmus maximus]XP_047184618.1 protein dispatched homolog 1 iso
MALSDASGDPLALGNGGHPLLDASGSTPSDASTLVSSSQDPLTAACSSDHLSADGDEEVAAKDVVSKEQQKQQTSSHVVQRANRPNQNGGVVKQNGSLRNLPLSSTASSSSFAAATDSQRLAGRHLPSTHTPSSASSSSSSPPPPLQPPPLCCQHCHFHSALCCPCGQQECPLFQNPGAGVGPGPVPHPGTTSSCPCCLSACTYSHPHPPHSASLLCLHHHHHHQRWQEHLQSHTHAAGISPARPFRFPKSYAELIADWPVVVLGVCTVLIVVCALVGVLVPDLPDFSDPLLGFEPRGTAIGQRLVTWNNMVKNTGYKATLANYPFKYADEQAKNHQEPRWPEDHFDRDKRQAEWDFSKEFFCDVPGDSYSRLVFTSAEGKSLWSTEAIKSMCNLDNTRVRSHRDYWSLCQRTNDASCCPSWTLGNYVAILTNMSSCQKITDREVSHTLKILRSCAKYYHNGTLAPDCWDMALRRKDQLKCASVPRKCTKYNAVYQILHFLVDKDFLPPKSLDSPPLVLKYSMLFSPTEKGESMMNIYLDNFENWNSSDGVTTVTGIEFGIKHDLFQDYLLTDTVYPAIAIVIVLLVMCVYTRSVFITLMTIIAIISSLIVSYFLYRMVFDFEFFPFMNLTALIILVGIGADDAFVLCDVWNYTKFDKPHAELAETVGVTLQHAALSMFVTSFTTAAAFYANYVSNITAIRCFGVYAGTAILVNYILMVTWLPAVVVLHERYLPNMLSCSKPQQQQRGYCTRTFWAGVCQKANKCLFTVSEASRIFFEKVLPCIVIKLRYLWLFWFLAITVGGAYVVCVNPKMKLPSLELAEFQVFRSSHPFERYDSEYKKLFMFERVHHGEELHMPITIIWGVTPEDNGDPLNPKNKGKLMLDSSFNISSPASQLWILSFCQRLRNQSFVFQSEEQDFTSCFIETFKQWMENQDCTEGSVYPCCSQSTFPYRPDVFELCIKRAIMELDRSTNYHLDSKTPGPRFDINDTIRAIVLEFKSTYLFTLAYEKMYQFYLEVDAWIAEELRYAPAGLSNGWFISNLEFYDLQDSLSDGTLVAMALSVAVAFSVMLLTTWNVIISLYAILSIAGTIFVTVGSLVLLGWELNVLESVTISVAVGLSVDFAVHYGVAYRLAPEPDREGKVIFSLSRMGSAIAMAALTTFVAGAMMMPSTVLAYTQLGTFMMLIMCISWAFATFFFQCMCRCMGPQGTCGQIPLPKKLQCQAFTEATATNPSAQGKASGQAKYQLDSRDGQVEHYELEPLASSLKTEDKPREEHEVCPQLYNGIPPHHHAAPYSHIHYKSKAETGRAGVENGFVATLSAPSRCQYSQNTNCTCGDPPSPHLPQQLTPHACAQPPQDSTSCPPAPHSGNTPCKQNTSLLPPNLDPVYTHMECRMHYIHCHPAHFHHCSQGRVAPRQGPVHSCHLRKYCVHTGSAREQRPQCPESAGQEEYQKPEVSQTSPDRSQNTSKAAPTQHHTRCPSPPQDSPHTACHERQKARDRVRCCGDDRSSATTAETTATLTDTCCQIPGNQEKPDSIPVAREQSVKECERTPRSERASSASPKKLYCFNRTLKVKCNSASDFSVPKSETSVPPIAINTNPSSESLC